MGFLSFFLSFSKPILLLFLRYTTSFNAGGDRSVSHQETYWLSFPSLTLLHIDRLSSTTRCTSSERNRSVHDHPPISSTTLPLHYKLNQRWNLPSCSLSRGKKKAKHKHNPKTRTFNNPKTQTTTDHNNAETQNTSPPKGKNKKRQLNPPLSSVSNKQQEKKNNNRIQQNKSTPIVDPIQHQIQRDIFRICYARTFFSFTNASRLLAAHNRVENSIICSNPEEKGDNKNTLLSSAAAAAAA